NDRIQQRKILAFICCCVLSAVPIDFHLPCLPAAIAELEVNSENTDAGPATVTVQHAVFVEDEPLLFHLGRHEASDNGCHFLRRVAGFQRHRDSCGWHESALPVGTASHSTFQWRLCWQKVQRSLKNGKVALSPFTVGCLGDQSLGFLWSCPGQTLSLPVTKGEVWCSTVCQHQEETVNRGA